MTKPILFNTEMVRAILAGNKTVTRRVVKPQPVRNLIHLNDGTTYGYWMDQSGQPYRPPYRPGDILYVRETWRIWKAHRYDADAHIDFRAGGDGVVLKFPYGCTDFANRDDYDSFVRKWGIGCNWHPSIHMPKEAARIFLRVKGVRVERLQDITPEQCVAEGLGREPLDEVGSEFIRGMFNDLWDSVIKPADLPLYGWDANPWVWVIEFERSREEEAQNDNWEFRRHFGKTVHKGGEKKRPCAR